MLLAAAMKDPQHGENEISHYRLLCTVTHVLLDIYTALWWQLREQYRDVAVIRDEFEPDAPHQKSTSRAMI